MQAGGEAGEFAGAADDTMAWDDDGDGVGTVGPADGTAGVGIIHAFGLFAVGDGLTEGDLLECLPGALLERGALGVQLEIEVLQVAGEVGLELVDDVVEWGGVFDGVWGKDGRAIGCVDVDGGQA